MWRRLIPRLRKDGYVSYFFVAHGGYFVANVGCRKDGNTTSFFVADVVCRRRGYRLFFFVAYVGCRKDGNITNSAKQCVSQCDTNRELVTFEEAEVRALHVVLQVCAHPRRI